MSNSDAPQTGAASITPHKGKLGIMIPGMGAVATTLTPAMKKRPSNLLTSTSFCSSGVPEIHTVVEGETELDELGGSTIGNSGAFTLFFGSATWEIGPRRAEKPQDEGAFSVSISAPVETLQSFSEAIS